MTLTHPSLQSTVDASCANLETTAAAMGVNLRRDVASVKDLEEILVALLDIDADESILSGATFMVGAYLGEILRSNIGGAWRNAAEGGLVLEVGQTAYEPVAKARKFASSPKGPDGLVFFAQAALARET